MLSGVAEKRIADKPLNNTQKACFKADTVLPKITGKPIVTRLVLLLTDAVLINVSFLISFLIRYGLPLPQRNFDPYRKSLLFLTVIYVSALVVFKVYRQRFPSSWELFKRVFCGLFIGTLLSVAFVYVFRIEWGAFPTSIFVTSFFINLLLVFKVNQLILKLRKRIRKKNK